MASEHIISDQIYRATNHHEGKLIGPLTHKSRPKAVALIEYTNTKTVQNENTNKKLNSWSAVENQTNGYPWDGDETVSSIENSDGENEKKSY
jgi:hypothetical protein